MTKTIDWQALARKLANPWWGPYAPHQYTFQKGGRRAGVGLVAKDPGEWNCMFLVRGNFSIPDSLAGHQEMIAHLVGGARLAACLLGGHTLGSYAMLMPPEEFSAWAQGAQISELPNQHQQTVRFGVQALLKQGA